MVHLGIISSPAHHCRGPRNCLHWAEEQFGYSSVTHLLTLLFQCIHKDKMERQQDGTKDGQQNNEEREVLYADCFKMDPSYYSDDGKLMYTIATTVERSCPLRMFRYVVIPQEFWAGDKDPGTRLLTDEELYETLEIKHNRRWKHLGYRLPSEPNILLFEYGPPPHVDPPTQEEIDRKEAIKREVERKMKEPLEIYKQREERFYEELKKLRPTSFPENEIPHRTVDEIGRLVIPWPESPLRPPPETKSSKSSKSHDEEDSRPRQLNNHVKEWAIHKMKKALFERAEETRREETNQEETRQKETDRDLIYEEPI